VNNAVHGFAFDFTVFFVDFSVMKNVGFPDDPCLRPFLFPPVARAHSTAPPLYASTQTVTPDTKLK
jgi:hypothetical protein